MNYSALPELPMYQDGLSPGKVDLDDFHPKIRDDCVRTNEDAYKRIEVDIDLNKKWHKQTLNVRDNVVQKNNDIRMNINGNALDYMLFNNYSLIQKK